MIQAQNYKLLFIGGAGAGKTTAITSISDTVPLAMEVPSTEQDVIGKSHTTVGFDYGEIALDDAGGKLRLYGAPGQQRFSFMWEILAQGALGVVMMVDNSRADALQNARETVSIFKSLFKEKICPVVLGATKSDLRKTPRVEDYQQMLAQEEMLIPAFMIDAREKTDVLTLVDALFSQMEVAALLENP